MKISNPMHRPDVAAKAVATNRKRWSEAAYQELEHQSGYGPNKAEAVLLGLIQSIGFRYTGDGSFWIGPCVSGKRRNPDFIYKSGTLKTAVLYHGRYWHARSDSDDGQELQDYSAAGWGVLVVTEVELKGDLAMLSAKVIAWLASLQSGPPV